MSSYKTDNDNKITNLTNSSLYSLFIHLSMYLLCILTEWCSRIYVRYV